MGPPVILLMHVPLQLWVIVVIDIAAFTLVFCTMMTFFLLVTFEIMQVVVLVLAEIAHPSVTDSVHMLPCSTITTEGPITSTAFRHDEECSSQGRWCGGVVSVRAQRTDHS